MTDQAAFDAEALRRAGAAAELLTRALRTGGAYADLFYERTVHHRLAWRQELRAGTLQPPRPEADRRVVTGTAFRVLTDDREGFAATAAQPVEALAAAADDAAAQAGPGRPARRVAPFTALPPLPDLPADAPDAAATSEKTALMQAAADAAFALDDRVCRVEVAYHDRVRRTLIATSDGTLHAEATLLLGLRVAVTLEAGGHTLTTHAVSGGPFGMGHFFVHPPEHLAREAVERAQRRAAAGPAATGTMPVVLAAGWGGVWLHEAVGHLLEADAVASDASPFAGRLGEAVAVPGVTLVDDATLPGGRATGAFDDEGTRAARTVLVEDGVLRGLLTDRRHARRMTLPRSGNGRRQDYRHPPLPRMTNLLLLAGETDPADLLAGTRSGLYVAALGHGVVQPGGGFVLDVLEGYRIEHGRLAAPVTGVRLIGTGPAVLGAVAGLGADIALDASRGLCRKAGQVVPVSVGMPTVLIGAMQVEPGGECRRMNVECRRMK